MKDYNTKDYYLAIGPDKDNGTMIYQVVNRTSSVVEYDDFILPRTIEAMVNLQEKLDTVIEEFNKPDSTILSLVGDGNEKGSLH